MVQCVYPLLDHWMGCPFFCKMIGNGNMTDNITLFWFRQDLRLSDNPGLYEAVQKGAVLPVYILDDACAGHFNMGGASRWWLHHSLTSLNQSLGNKLNVYKGCAKEIIFDIAMRNKVDAIYWNRCYEPWRIRDDAIIKTACKQAGIEVKSFNGSLLWEPWDVLKKDKTPYKVFTPFYRNGCLQALPPRKEYQKPKHLTLINDQMNACTINDLKLLPTIRWYDQMEQHWHVGEDAAHKRLQAFIESGLTGYKEDRNYPSKANVSKLSPHLHFGEISPHYVWHNVKAHGMLQRCEGDLDCFLSELGWREFSYYLLYHFPELPRKNFQSKFDHFSWSGDITLLTAWQQGQTGYPIIDAGMRELWQTGYMHNRVRMIVGSFLVKNMLLHWHHGADWFWDCLVDADLANNSASWQWIAGSGADAAPYFRIFNPITQGEKFDPDGNYIRHFVPELNKLPTPYLFNPSTAPVHICDKANVRLGVTYPKPIVDIESSRKRALATFQEAFKSI